MIKGLSNEDFDTLSKIRAASQKLSGSWSNPVAPQIQAPLWQNYQRIRQIGGSRVWFHDMWQ